MNNAASQEIAEALNYLEAELPAELHVPVIGIICGSGLNDLANTVLPEPRYQFSYADIPHFPLSTGMKELT